MISWLQIHLIKHGRWIFSILLAIVVVSFVFVIGNTPGLPGTERGLGKRDFYGVNFANPAEVDQVDREAALSLFLNTGSVRVNQEELRQLAVSRIALLDLASDLGLPGPSTSQLQKFIVARPAFFGPDGRFDPNAYQRFLDSLQTNPNFTKAVLDKVLRDEFRLEQVSNFLRGAGFVTPYEGEQQARRDATTWSLEVAQFHYYAFNPEITLTPEQVRAHFDNNPRQYEAPLRQRLSWVYFPASAYLAGLDEPNDATLQDFLERNIGDYLDPQEPPAGEPAPPLPTPEEPLTAKRDTILADWKIARAREQARLAASAFALSLYEKQLSRDSAELATLLDASGLERGTFAPVARDTPPTDAGDGATWEILQACRSLNEQQYFTDALPFRDGSGVFLLDGIIEPVVPPFESIRDRVENDLREVEKRRLFNEAGVRIAAALRTGLANGLDFRSAAARTEIEISPAQKIDRLQAAFLTGRDLTTIIRELRLSVRSFAGFTPRTTPQGLSTSLFAAAQKLSPGEVSDMVQVGDYGFFILVTQRDPGSFAADSDVARQALANLSSNTGMLFVRQFLNELVDRGAHSEEAPL